MTKRISAQRIVQAAIAAATTAVLSTSIAAAWHPMAYIYKDVENTTTHSAVMQADTVATAIVAHPGDTLVFHIWINNQASGANDQMVSTLATDTLPDGLTLVSQDSLNYGTIAPRQIVTRNITVKVAADAPINTTIKNEACFTGTSAENTNPQKGCDVALIKIVPTPTPSPSPSHTPSPTPSPTHSATPSPTYSHTPSPSASGQVLGDTDEPTLPDTGAASLVASAFGLGAMAVSGVAYIRSRRNL